MLTISYEGVSNYDLHDIRRHKYMETRPAVEELSSRHPPHPTSVASKNGDDNNSNQLLLANISDRGWKHAYM